MVDFGTNLRAFEAGALKSKLLYALILCCLLDVDARASPNDAVSTDLPAIVSDPANLNTAARVGLLSKPIDPASSGALNSFPENNADLNHAATLSGGTNTPGMLSPVSNDADARDSDEVKQIFDSNHTSIYPQRVVAAEKLPARNLWLDYTDPDLYGLLLAILISVSATFWVLKRQSHSNFGR